MQALPAQCAKVQLWKASQLGLLETLTFWRLAPALPSRVVLSLGIQRQKVPE